MAEDGKINALFVTENHRGMLLRAALGETRKNSLQNVYEQRHLRE
jgi:hypothetical protein